MNPARQKVFNRFSSIATLAGQLTLLLPPSPFLRSEGTHRARAGQCELLQAEQPRAAVPAIPTPDAAVGPAPPNQGAAGLAGL